MNNQQTTTAAVVGLRELRENMNNYIARVQAGRSFLVVRRSKPVFRLAPPDQEGAWEEVIDFTKIKKGGVGLNELLARL